MSLVRTRLVAGREVREGIRNKSFIVATGISALLVFFITAPPKVVTNAFRNEADIALVGQSPPGIESAIGVLLGRDRSIKIVTLPNEAEAIRQVRSKKIDVAVIDGQELIIKKPGSKLSLTGPLTLLLATGGEPLKQIPIRSLERSEGKRDPFGAFIGAALLFGLIAFYGQWILVGVAEEKSSRVVEVLLASVRPKELLVGKVAGIGAIALTQASVVGVTAVMAAWASDGDVLRGRSLPLVLAYAPWFLLGLTFYAFLYAAVGSMASRTEEARTMALPVQIPLLAAYIAASTALSSSGDSVLLKVMSYFPPTAPLTMPLRVAFGTASRAEAALSMGVMMTAIMLVALLASKIYERSILRTSKRLRYSEVLRPAD